MRRVIRASILLFGAVATVMALKVQSVQALWFFTSDLVFVLLFPQLCLRALRPEGEPHGSIAAFAVSLVLARGRRRAAARPAGALFVSRVDAVQDRGRGHRHGALAARVARDRAVGFRRGGSMEVREGFEPSNSGFAGRRVSHFATAPNPCLSARPDYRPLVTGTCHSTAARAGGKQTVSLQA